MLSRLTEQTRQSAEQFIPYNASLTSLSKVTHKGEFTKVDGLHKIVKDDPANAVTLL